MVIGGAGFLVYREVQHGREAVRAAERDHLAQDFSEVGQCFFGAQLPADAITFRKISDIASRLDGAPGNWPFDCHERVDRFRTRVETAHRLDRDLATRLSSALYKLDEGLRESRVQLPELTDQLRDVWTLADACGIRAGTPETAAPPLPRELAPGAAKLPIERLTAIGGGPTWQLLGQDAKGLSQCGFADGKLACKRISVPAEARIDFEALRARGTWSSERFILLEAANAGWLLADQKLEPLSGAHNLEHAHVSEAGDVIALTSKEILIWPRETPAKRVALDRNAAVAKADPDSRDFPAMALLGPRLLVVRPNGDLVRFDIDTKGTLGKAHKLDFRVSSALDFRTCRAGAHDAIFLLGRVLFDTPKGLVERDGAGIQCSASGVVWTSFRGCTPSGCTDYPELVFRSESGRHDLPVGLLKLPRDRVGAGDTIAWQARLTGGLLVRGNAADIATTVAIASLEEAAATGPSSKLDLLNGDGPEVELGVYGGPSGGVVLYRNGRGPQLGVAVDAAGQVSPLTIEGL